MLIDQLPKIITPRLISICESNGFILSFENRHVLGPIGMLLYENLLSEWKNSLIYGKEQIFFSEFKPSYKFAKDLLNEQLPFGFAEIGDSLKCTMFVAEKESLHFFHQWQKLRRMWWRKFSPTPGRYYTTDIQGEEEKQSTEIRAKYPTGEEIVEKIEVVNDVHPALTKDESKNKFNHRRTPSSYLTCEINAQQLVLNTISDAFEQLPYENSIRTTFRFHRKLAPYKIAFAVYGETAGLIGELNELAQYLCRKIRAKNITSLILPTNTDTTREELIHKHDLLGIPYTIIVNEGTLRTGILLLRSRDTTLKEEVHVKDLDNYIGLIFKNY